MSNRSLLTSACGLISACLCLAAPILAAPTVSNVAVVQQPNGAGGTEAVITYDLVSPDGPCEITVLLSKDGGVDGFPFTASSITGDVTAVSAGTGLTIVWDIAADFPGEEIPSAIVRVFADDGCPVGQPDAFTTDEDSTVSGSVFADNGSGPDSDTLTGALMVAAVNGDPASVGSPTMLPSGAVVTINSGGSFSYNPNGAFESLGSGAMAMDSLTYTLTDGISPCNQLVTVSVTINGVNDAPIVNGESFDTAGNTTLEVAAVQSINGSVFVTGSLLDNDSDIDGPGALTASFVSVTPGASASVNLDGTFTLSPPSGSNSPVTLNYSVSDGSASTPGTATISPVGMIWYVKNDAPGGGTGTMASPFNTLTDVEAPSLASQIIYLHAGDGFATNQSSGVTLKASQRLIGEGVALQVPATINGVSNPVLRAAGSTPLLRNASGSAVNLSTGNHVRGINIGDTIGGHAVAGANIGTLTLSDVTVAGQGGIISITGSGDFGSSVNFASVASSSPGNLPFISLNNVTGTLGIGSSGGLANSGAADAIVVDGGSVSFDFPGVLPKSTAGRILAVSNTTGGTITLSNAAAGGISSSGSSQGIRISNCAGSVVIGGAGGPAGTVSLTGLTGIEIRGAAATPQTGSVTLNNAVIQTSAGAGNIAVRVDGDQGTAAANGVSGTIAFNNVDITNPGGSVATIIGLGGGSVTFDAASSIARSDGGLGIQVDSCAGGVVTFAGSSKVLNTGTNGAVALTSNSGCTINFTNGGLDIDTTSGTGFSATGGGTFTVQGSANTINSGTGTALSVNNTTIGAGNVTLQQLSRNGGSTSAVSLVGTGSGTLTVTGTTATAGTGGTIQNTTGADAIVLNNVGGAVELRNMIIQDIAHASDAGAPFDTRSGVDAIHGQQVLGGLILNNVQIRRISDNAVNGSLLADGQTATVWTGLQIRNSLIELTNRFHVANVGDADHEGMVRIVGLTGTVVVDSTTFQNGAEALDLFTHTSGTMDMTVQRSSFLNMNKQFPSGIRHIVGGHGIDVIVMGSSDAVIRIGDPAEASSALGNVFHDNSIGSIRIAHNSPSETGFIQAVISQNEFTVDDHLTDALGPGSFAFNFPQGGVAIAGTGGGLQAIISNNMFDQVMHGSGGVGQLNLISQDDADVQFIVRGNTFLGPWDFITQITARNNNALDILWEDNTVPFLNLTNAQLANTDIAGLPNQPLPYETYFVDVKDGGRLDLTIRNELIPDHDRAGNTFRDESFVFGAPALGGTGGSIILDLRNNRATNGYGFLFAGPGNISLFRNGSQAMTAAGVLQDNGNSGGAVNPNQTPPSVTSVGGTVSLSNAAPQVPSITIP